MGGFYSRLKVQFYAKYNNFSVIWHVKIYKAAKWRVGLNYTRPWTAFQPLLVKYLKLATTGLLSWWMKLSWANRADIDTLEPWQTSQGRSRPSVQPLHHFHCDPPSLPWYPRQSFLSCFKQRSRNADGEPITNEKPQHKVEYLSVYGPLHWIVKSIKVYRKIDV